MCHFTPDDVVYCAMPLYHANAQILAFAPPLLAGGGLALARRFSKTHFLADVRRYGATLFNYVGNPLAYIMDTPGAPDDADNPLRLAYGNEAPRQYIDAFAAASAARCWFDSFPSPPVRLRWPPPCAGGHRRKEAVARELAWVQWHEPNVQLSSRQSSSNTPPLRISLVDVTGRGMGSEDPVFTRDERVAERAPPGVSGAVLGAGKAGEPRLALIHRAARSAQSNRADATLTGGRHIGTGGEVLVDAAVGTEVQIQSGAFAIGHRRRLIPESGIQAARRETRIVQADAHRLDGR